MGILFIDLGEVRTFEIAGVMTIGRDGRNDIVVAHPTVSRAHARIERDPGGYVITDFNSRNGTRVNGKNVEAGERLADGARLRIGHVRAWFFERMPERLPRSISNRDRGVIFGCTCGQRLWSSTETVGMSVVCGGCHKNVQVPDPATLASEEAAGTVAGVLVATSSNDDDVRPVCGVCQWPIERQERAYICAACHTHYHLDCWTENRGCATYGCENVNALAPKERPAVPVLSSSAPPPPLAARQAGSPGPVLVNDRAAEPAAVMQPQGLAWSYMLLALAVVGSLLGLLAFGVPAGLVAAVAMLRLLVSRTDSKAALAAAVVIGGLGTVAGVLISRFWWFNEPLF